jgi:hypothetical protein
LGLKKSVDFEKSAAQINSKLRPLVDIDVNGNIDVILFIVFFLLELISLGMVYLGGNMALYVTI